MSRDTESESSSSGDNDEFLKTVMGLYDYKERSNPNIYSPEDREEFKYWVEDYCEHATTMEQIDKEVLFNRVLGDYIRCKKGKKIRWNSIFCSVAPYRVADFKCDCCEKIISVKRIKIEDTVYELDFNTMSIKKIK